MAEPNEPRDVGGRWQLESELPEAAAMAVSRGRLVWLRCHLLPGSVESRTALVGALSPGGEEVGGGRRQLESEPHEAAAMAVSRSRLVWLRCHLPRGSVESRTALVGAPGPGGEEVGGG